MATPKKKNPKKAGRHTKYSEQLAEKICERISTSTDRLRKICSELGIDYSNVKRWLLKYPEFRAQYSTAKELQADEIFDEMLEIADDDSDDSIYVETQDKDGQGAKRVMNSEFIQRSKLRVETRFKIASKLAPKKYGDKVEVNQHNTGEQTIRFVRDE